MLMDKSIFKAWHHIDVFLRLINLILEVGTDRMQTFVQACNQHLVSLGGLHRFKMLI